MIQGTATTERRGEEGYLLLGLVVACFLLALFLAVAAPRVAKQLERDREVESEHRAQEYVRAIQLFYKRNNRFPNSVEELLGNAAGAGGMSLGGNAMNVRFLRQQYKDPLTGGEYRPIHMGEAKTEVKGFFGEPLQGMPVGNLGAASGMQSNLAGNSAGGSSPGIGQSVAGQPGTAQPGTAQPGTAQPGTAQPGTPSSPFGSSSIGSTSDPAGSTGGIASTSATSFQGSKGVIIGFGSDAKGPGLVEWNGSANIEDWEFLYDPRVEMLKARVSIFGGTPAAAGNGSLGSGFAPPGGATGLTGGVNGTGTPSAGGSSTGTATSTQ